MDISYIKKKDWQKFLKNLLSEHNLYAPFEGISGLEYQKVTPQNIENIVYPGVRLTQSVKFFIYPPQETVGSEGPHPQKKNIILGVKACDLKALSVLDEIFLGGDFVDPFFKSWRDNTILISSDCTQPGEKCFCELLGGKPFAESGFDLNLSFIDDGVVAEIGSEKGKEILEKHNVSRHSVQEVQVKARNEKRVASAKKLDQTNRLFSFGDNVTEVVKGNYESPVWNEFAETCVGCCACTNICPSCNCFLLSELSPDSAAKFEKLRTWDSCQSTGFARVAGGANPRKKLAERFRNRFYCKLQYKPESFKLLACTGCGRCIEACQGKIDIREVLTKVSR